MAVDRTGLEPVTSSVSWRRASQLRQRSVVLKSTAARQSDNRLSADWLHAGS